MPADRLESWKEIAAYFRRGVRTVTRWEKEEGLPVHRHVHRKLGTVYARRSELDAWQESRKSRVDQARAVGGASPPVSRLMLAVLPFANLSGGSEPEYVADGLTEEMIGHLGRFNPQTLGVIARTTMMQYKEARKSVRQIGEQLKVDYILEGSVRREGDRVRVTAHLIQVVDQTPLWSGTYEQSLRSILALQSELAADIGREIRLKLAPPQEAGGGGQDTVNPDAYDAHLQGRQLLYGFTPRSVRRSVRSFQRAIELDPTYAAAYASLAEAYEQLPMWADQPSAATLPLALKAAQQALQLDPNLPEAYASLGLIDTYYSWDWTSAERHFQKALSLNPGCSPARQWYAEFLAEMGRIDEALETIEQAQRHDPLSRSIQATRAFVLLLGRRYDEAIAQAKRVLDLDPTYPMALIRLGIAYTGKGMNDAAVRTFQQAREAAPELLDCTALLAYANALAGNRREASQQMNQLRRRARQRYVPPFLFANICIAQGDYDRAVQLIEEEYKSRGWYLLLIKHSPQFAPLQSHPRYKRLIRWMKFPG